ncbi:uncharacterized protein LOC117173835 [Belonocnema kinseyi]|uniref:uncharacterized protein LOC117173835 n=1 Tax=Belonocnema kinseyi TaxID=2817044 RepID=UPI00143D3183|nr:uncharacterized protein LOC117173835 [Belonocnema kinseyi]
MVHRNEKRARKAGVKHPEPRRKERGRIAVENVHVVEVANLGISNNEITGSDSVSSASGTGSGGVPAGFPFQVGYREAGQDYTLYLLGSREEERTEWIRAIRTGMEMKSVQIGDRPVPERKTIENLANILRVLCLDWELDIANVKAIVTDNGPNVLGACKQVLSAQKHISCLAHNLNLAVTDALGLYKTNNQMDQEEVPLPLPVFEDNEDEEDQIILDVDVEDTGLKDDLPSFKRVVSKIKKIMTEWRKAEAECLRLIQEICTRWNSVYEMLDRFLLLRELVQQVLAKITREKTSKEKPPPMIAAEEEGTCEGGSGSSKTSMASHKGDLRGETLREYNAVHPVAFNIKHSLLAEIEKRLGFMEKLPMPAKATILDPRFKKLHFTDAGNFARALSSIDKELKAKIAVSVDEERARKMPLDQPGDSQVNDIWVHHDALRSQQFPEADTDTAGGLSVELRQYLNQPTGPRYVNPFEEWNNIKHAYPNLYKVTLEYLPILATSVPSERLFSKASKIITKLRNRLSGKHLNQLIFLASLDFEMWK